MKSPKNAFDAVLTSVPLDRTAAQVTARGEHWVPETALPPGMMHWKSPPPMKAFEIDRSNGQQTDLTGKKFGKFTVVGLLNAEGGKNRGARWVCRCTCGDYEARSSQAILVKMAGLAGAWADKLNIGYQCFYCVQWELAKHRYQKHGARPLSDFTKSRTRIIARKPQTIIADVLYQLGLHENVETAADKVIAEINRGGYRIRRDPNEQPIADDEPTGR